MRPTWSLYSPSVTFLFHDFVKEMPLQNIRTFRKLWVQHLQILSLGAGRNGKRMGKGGRERGDVGMEMGRQTKEETGGLLPWGHAPAWILNQDQALHKLSDI